MLGAIIGDIVGSRWEFNPTNDYNFELFSDENGFTDDTICTVAVADPCFIDQIITASLFMNGVDVIQIRREDMEEDLPSG
jgi:ADP-ribosylglycohydrolase